LKKESFFLPLPDALLDFVDPPLDNLSSSSEKKNNNLREEQQYNGP
jgi:hypothetical protein